MPYEVHHRLGGSNIMNAIEALRPALYYPYIHIRSEEWLKATLLCMPTVRRIVPETYTPEDNPAIIPYTTIKGPYGELLQSVPAYSHAAIEAQDRLLQKLRENAATIKKKYSRTQAPVVDEYWIHVEKFSYKLLEYLERKDLAWQSADPHGFGHRRWYALHPTLGKAIMTTLGLSIAREQNFDIVTADGPYHEALLATDERDMFEKLIGSSNEPTSTSNVQTRRSLGQLVICIAGVNYKALRPERIPELQASRHFQNFQDALRVGASTIDSKADQSECDRQLKREAEKIVTAWGDTRQDLTKDLREVIFEGTTLAMETLRTALTGPHLFELAVVGGLGLWRLSTKGHDYLTDRHRTHPYLSQVIRAQDDALRLMYPLGL